MSESSIVPPGAPRPAPDAVPPVARAKPPYETVEEIVAYKQTASGPLHLHVVRPRGDEPPASGRGCLVFFHGGGWRRGRPQQFVPFATLMAQRGLVAMSVEYRLIQDPAKVIPDEGVADARSAMRWVRTHAADLGIDPARIGAGGGSAGAHLALMAALDAPVDDPADDASVSPRPAALVLLNAPLDFDEYESQVPTEVRHRYSPHHLLTADLPPTLLMHGTRDKVIPFEQVTAFEEKARALGVASLRVQSFPGRGHGFFNRGKGEPGDFLKVAKEMAAFVRQLGWTA